ncbi:MAG TPA: hypothetical protein VM470_10170 [Acidimicrobiia bacterium]|nr:hypothetical protein [Acidimicrobiia bacterium]
MRLRSVLTATLLLWLIPVSVLAHSDEGEITVTLAEQGSGTAIILEVGIVYTDDGHLAEEASVTATLTGTGGETVGPIDLARSSGGAYGAEVTVPTSGEWSVLISSENPTATTEATVTLTEPTTTTSPSTTTTSAPATTTSTATTQPDVTTTAPEDGGGDSGSLPILPILAAGALVGGGFAFFRHSRH